MIEQVTRIDADTTVVILCGPTAVQLWSRSDAVMPATYVNHDLAQQLQQRAGRLAERLDARDIARVLSLGYGCGLPFHALVPGREQARKGKTASYHSLSMPLPPGSLVGALPYHGNEKVKLLVASPEFTYLQFAGQTTRLEAIDFGNELCGGYAINLRAPQGMCDRQAVSTKARISHYLNGAGHIKGIRTANLAAKYIVANAMSPWESRFAMLLHLPTAYYGGMGFESLAINQEVKLSGKARRMFRNDTCVPDFQLPNTTGVIELDGDLVHSAEERVAVDRRKSNALMLMGREVLRVDVHQMREFSGLMNVCESIRALAGLGPEQLTDEQVGKRSVLHHYLLHGMSCAR